MLQKAPNQLRPLQWGGLAALAGTALFAGIAFFALRPSFLTDFDRNAAENLVASTEDHTFRRQVMVTFTFLGDILPLIVFAAGLGFLQLSRGRWLLALACWLVPLGGALLNLGLKTAFDRERPPAIWRDSRVHETNQSFPSGHAMGATVGYGMAAYLVLLSVPRRGPRFAAVVAAILLALGVGLSRVYLRAHWFSDVLAGWVIGISWLGFCLGLVEFRKRASLPSVPKPS